MLGHIGKVARHVMKANGLGVPSWSILSKKICGILKRLSLFLKERNSRNQRNTSQLGERSTDHPLSASKPTFKFKIIQTKIIQSFIGMYIQ